MKQHKHFSFAHKWFCLLLPLFVAVGMNAQVRSITGVASSADGETLIGATVLVANSTDRGTVAEFDGSFSVKAETGESIYFSYTGYQTRIVEVGAENNLNVTLETASEILDEVVVVGYGTQRKSDLTGAVSSVSGEELRSSVTSNIDQALHVRVAGVQVTQNSGQPDGAASIRIRGSNSITGSSEPLYVIDGIPFQGDGASVAGFDWAGGANGRHFPRPARHFEPRRANKRRQYLQRKPERAAQLFKTVQYNVSDVSYMVGYNDVKSFREQFNKEFGVNPSGYGSEG